jgi:hypothetical protein
MKSMKIVLLSLVTLSSLSLVGCVSRTRERIVERDHPTVAPSTVVIDRDAPPPPPRDTTINVNR